MRACSQYSVGRESKGGRVLTEGAPADVLTAELMSRLYGVDVLVSSLHGDMVRVCTPVSILQK